MIIGVGTDIIEINRIGEAISKEGFVKKYFTDREIIFFQSRNFKEETIAGSFAAKEAIAKALGTGFSGFGAIDIEIIHDGKGTPYVVLAGNAKVLAMAKQIENISISISHCRDYATAYAVAEGGLNHESCKCSTNS
ncbi:MAG TPA: holo-ACP synthase [Lachnospiraceae bacterium]|nr:holo-ACP synthase [Lachnospiraceae bacterium]